MTKDAPLVAEVYPNLADELVELLQAAGEHRLATSIGELPLVGECTCRDDFCQSLRTAPHPEGEPYGPGHRCVPLRSTDGMLALDVVDDRIMYVEVLHRAPLRPTR
ncbi:hypothetical protein ACFVMC_15950 [Nocardia sp. NPDC127579]|uniref:hypothetical protein n=1 Tax=Nocardia sp. NPDC127579 TaxID=3345402 RepID=UPI003635C421